MTTDEMGPLTPEEEAELQKEIELAMKQYEGIAPPALLAQMRERLEEGLRSHPVPRTMLRRMAPRPAVDASREITRSGAKKGQANDGQEDE